MANSENVVPGAGPGSVLAVPLYEEQDDIHVAKGLVDQDASTYEWTGPQEITLGPDFPAADDVPVRVYRQTEDDALPAILDPEEGFDFQGANANWQRTLFLIQELKDRGGVAGIEEVLALLQAAVDDAEGFKDGAEDARDAAVTAQGLSEDARDAASLSAIGAAASAVSSANAAVASAESAEDALASELAVEALAASLVRVDTPQFFSDTQKKQARDNTGARGNLFKVTVVTVSNPTFAFDTKSKYAEVELFGGGGSGGGAGGSTPAGSVQVGAGGGAGSLCYKFHEITTSTAAIIIGTGAAGVSGAAGAAGGTSTYVAGSVNLSAGGGGAGGMASVSTTGGIANGAGGGTATGGDDNVSGGMGGSAFGFGTGDMAVAVGVAGFGGSPPRGGSSRGSAIRSNSATQTAGLQAINRAGGGSGAATANGGTAQAGGDGGSGYAVIKEYY